MSERMPVMFVGHGSPMNAVEDNEFSRAWRAAGAALPRPKAILCVSAHWESYGTQVTAMDQPRTIYDFYGFPPEMYAMIYPAPGSPELAEHVREMIGKERVALDQKWGYDHGAWSVLTRMFPEADVPVIQLSLDVNLAAQSHYNLGKKLGALRNDGVLILGSGNIVHNLRMVMFEEQAYDWAVEFDGKVRDWIAAGDHDPIIHYENGGQAAALSINSAEHYKPLLYVLGASEKGEPVNFFTEKVFGGSISMRSLRIG